MRIAVIAMMGVVCTGVFYAPAAVAQSQYGVQPDAPIVGWICTIDGRRSLQFSQCPATMPRGQTVHVNGHSTYTGEPIQGTANVEVQTPVQSQPLTADGVCAVLGDPSVRIPHHGSSDVYERGMLKSRYCGF